VTLAFQAVFLMMARDPARYHPLMIPWIIEKPDFVIPTATLYRYLSG
jgi:hypothetical protein